MPQIRLQWMADGLFQEPGPCVFIEKIFEIFDDIVYNSWEKGIQAAFCLGYIMLRYGSLSKIENVIEIQSKIV